MLKAASIFKSNMAMCSIAVTFRGKKYVGEYEVTEDIVRVLFEDRIKTGVLRGRDPELLARIFFIELVSQAEAAKKLKKQADNKL